MSDQLNPDKSIHTLSYYWDTLQELCISRRTLFFNSFAGISIITTSVSCTHWQDHCEFFTALDLTAALLFNFISQCWPGYVRIIPPSPGLGISIFSHYLGHITSRSAYLGGLFEFFPFNTGLQVRLTAFTQRLRGRGGLPAFCFYHSTLFYVHSSFIVNCFTQPIDIAEERTPTVWSPSTHVDSPLPF